MGRLSNAESDNCIRLLENGMSKGDVANLYKINRSTVIRLPRRFEQTGSHEYRQKPFRGYLARVTTALTFLTMLEAQKPDNIQPPKKIIRTGKYPPQRLYCPGSTIFRVKILSIYKDQLEKKPSKKLVTFGEWSAWSQWSPCSRSCGGGVTHQTRQCISRAQDPRFIRRQRRRRQSWRPTNGCVGLYKRIHLCNNQDCPSDRDFRYEQCASYNNRPFKGRTYYWEPFNRENAECTLNCRPVGLNFYATLNKTVIDGTPCSHPVLSTGKAAPKGTRGVCVDGYCKSVNSRGVIGGVDDHQEECAACLKGGCRSINGIYTRPDLPPGYSLVAQIPAGACRVLVQQLKHTRNFLALKNANGSYFINGDWKFSNSRVFEGAGTKFTYIKQDSTSLETISSPGPLANTVDIMIVNHQANPGVKYGYALPIDDRPNISPPLLKRPTLEASGIDTRSFDPLVFNTNLTLKDQPLPHPIHRRTRIRRKHFHWKITGLTPCTKSCGGGTQTYIKGCFRDVPGHNPIPAHERRCIHLDPPATVPIRCNIENCSAFWDASWSTCSASCGDGVQQLIPQCKQDINGRLNLVSEDLCPKPKPFSQSRTCREATCDISDNELPPITDDRPSVKSWTTGPWSQCSTTCGIGQKSRSVICPSGQCHPEDRPIHAEYCNLGPCEASPPSFSHSVETSASNHRHTATLSESSTTFSPWLLTEWSHCSEACGTGTQTRLALCDQNQCPSESKPDTSRACSSDKQCDGKWFSGPWGDCSDACNGQAKQKREVYCIAKIRGSPHITNDMTCPVHLKPAEEQPCQGGCPPQWFSGDWGPCEGSCPVGVQRRDVKCMDIYKRPSNSCPEDEMPISKRACACSNKENSNFSSRETNNYKPVQDEPVDRSCVDKIRKCKLAVQARLCHYPYYVKNCCESCKKAHQE